MKGILIFIGVLAAVLLLTYGGLRYCLGVKFELGRSKMETKGNMEHAPLGVVRMIRPSPSEKYAAESVGIHAFNEIYAAIGVQPSDFERWERKHGMYGSGITASGEMLAPGYPILSKVSSMYIDPVTLTRTETAALIQECQRAIFNSKDESAKHELEAINSLAERALSDSAVIQFGHP